MFVLVRLFRYVDRPLSLNLFLPEFKVVSCQKVLGERRQAQIVESEGKTRTSSFAPSMPFLLIFKIFYLKNNTKDFLCFG